MLFTYPAIDTRRRETMAMNLWTAPERLYLDAAGNVVKAKDPTRQTLLVAAGATLPLARARELGLASQDAEQAGSEAGPTPDADAAAVAQKLRNRAKPPANKLKTPAPEDKGKAEG